MGKTSASKKDSVKKQNIRILIADDHPVTREGLALILNHQDDMEVVAEAKDGVEVIELYNKLKPDIAILDVQMPKLNGAQATEAIIAQFPKAKVILFTTYDGTEDVFRGMKAGAKIYMVKDTPSVTMLGAIRAAHLGQRFVMPNIAEKLLEAMESERLTDKQLQVLFMVADGLSNQEIARQMHVVEGTIKTHVAAIIAKLNVTSRTEAIAEAQKRGLIRR